MDVIIIGDYEYNSKDLIGHGAFAVVFKGRNRKVRMCYSFFGLSFTYLINCFVHCLCEGLQIINQSNKIKLYRTNLKRQLIR